ncbi:dephospho-CoA kinase [Clostridium homopropionicum DSM 5847]|uniref:Dephospho-CoA kinase n=1 Tax=Clostridium homopropionicum DSM 5847 TaxID=1121318 RepID=A0A0L6ZBI0_9CLOT|nr:dephospho-CoA kinase [Clostridium homopropionicum]KOA20158.1 dephospho-CoA kinase [Clostridium homopropionicum DSM 5847]SFG60938.1 dephospho-CoA kinase [Clostridium homopropionicum]
MIKVGLTGGIGSGKSTVSNILREQNIPIIDADIISREVLELYPEIIEKIKTDFGFEFVDENGKLKRREFGNYIFKNKTHRINYEKIIIPFIKTEIFKRLDQYNELGEEICIVDAPTLIEHSIHEDMDANILVWVCREIQIDRVIKRDLLEEHQVLDRINSQMTLEEKKSKVNFIIDNSGDLKKTREQINKILAAIKNIREE